MEGVQGISGSNPCPAVVSRPPKGGGNLCLASVIDICAQLSRLTASHEERDIIIDVVRRTADVVFMPLTVGGGIRTIEDIRALLNAGADKVSIMTAAVVDPDLMGEAAVMIGSANLVVAIDARRRDGDALVAKASFLLRILEELIDELRCDTGQALHVTAVARMQNTPGHLVARLVTIGHHLGPLAQHLFGHFKLLVHDRRRPLLARQRQSRSPPRQRHLARDGSPLSSEIIGNSPQPETSNGE